MLKRRMPPARMALFVLLLLSVYFFACRKQTQQDDAPPDTAEQVSKVKSAFVPASYSRLKPVQVNDSVTLQSEPEWDKATVTQTTAACTFVFVPLKVVNTGVQSSYVTVKQPSQPQFLIGRIYKGSVEIGIGTYLAEHSTANSPGNFTGVLIEEKSDGKSYFLQYKNGVPAKAAPSDGPKTEGMICFSTYRCYWTRMCPNQQIEVTYTEASGACTPPSPSGGLCPGITYTFGSSEAVSTTCVQIPDDPTTPPQPPTPPGGPTTPPPPPPPPPPASPDGVDCTSFAYTKTTLANWQEAGLNRIRLKWNWIDLATGSSITKEVYIDHVVFGLPTVYGNGQTLSAGAAATRSVTMLNQAKIDTYQQFSNTPYNPGADPAIVIFFKNRLNTYMQSIGGTAGTTGSGSPGIIFKDEIRAFFTSECK